MTAGFFRNRRRVLLMGMACGALLAGCRTDAAVTTTTPSPLAGKVISVDAGHGDTAKTDSYRIGVAGEREEWINLRVALELQSLLEQAGATVVMTRSTDVFVPLAERARIARDAGAEAIVSVHHNATADRQVNFPIVYFHGNASENQASVALGQALVEAFHDAGMFPAGTPSGVISDHAIFPSAGAALLRESYGIPGVIAEASFFSNPDEEQRLKRPEYNRLEARAYLAALESFFSQPQPPVLPKYSQIEQLPPFRAVQEAERMSADAGRWHEAYAEGVALAERDPGRALALLEESARLFPDSPLAGDIHARRARLLEQLGRKEEAVIEAQRAREHYPAAPG